MASLYFKSILLLCLIWIATAHGQVSIQGRYKPSLLKFGYPVVELPHLDNALLTRQEELRSFGGRPGMAARSTGQESGIEAEVPDPVLQLQEPVGAGPYTFGRGIDIDIDIQKDGAWYDLPNNEGRVWKIAFKSPTARSLNLIFDQFKLPEGAELYVHGETASLGAFTGAVNNKPHLGFATTPLPGGFISLEYFEPMGVTEPVLMHIESIVHGFRALPGQEANPAGVISGAGGLVDPAGYVMPSGKCNINAPACAEAKGYLDQTRSAVILMTGKGQKYCSGSLLNNVLQDGKQYFLTAFHCVDDGQGGHRFDLVGFNYYSTKCPNNNVMWPLNQTAQGLTLKAMYAQSDFALYEIQETIPNSYNAYMAGWNLSPTATNGKVFTIHHPSGDVKKISIFNGNLTAACWSECPNKYHLRVSKWTKGNLDQGVHVCEWMCICVHPFIRYLSLGTTEPGSSGAPLFNSDGLLIGQLHGGSASCFFQGYDVFGALQASYNASGTSGTRLLDYLNPRGDARVKQISGAYLQSLRNRLK